MLAHEATNGPSSQLGGVAMQSHGDGAGHAAGGGGDEVVGAPVVGAAVLGLRVGAGVTGEVGYIVTGGVGSAVG